MNPVLVRNGVFAVLLGNGNPITENILNGNVWLEIKVGDDVPLSPRQQIVSVPFAIKANTVPDGAITPPKINTNGAAAGQSLTFNGSSVLWDNPLARGLLLPFATSLSSTTVGEEVNT